MKRWADGWMHRCVGQCGGVIRVIRDGSMKGCLGAHANPGNNSRFSVDMVSEEML